jgi:hypothetical protein
VQERIPNQFLFIFGLKEQREPFHLSHYLCIESCWQVNQPERIYFYFHHEPFGPYWKAARERVIPVRVDLIPLVSRFHYGLRNWTCKKYRYAHQSDFIRLEKLVEKGGIYADIDTIFVHTIPPHLFDKPFVLGREDDIFCTGTHCIQPSLCNALIMSRKHSEFAHLWLTKMKTAFDGSWSNHSTLLPQQLSEQYPELIHIEPSRSFYKHMWTRQGIHTLLEGCDKDYEGVISMHLWSHLWWSKKRRDFSDFHEGLLTEHYIREVDTTYNLVARRFLPEKG